MKSQRAYLIASALGGSSEELVKLFPFLDDLPSGEGSEDEEIIFGHQQDLLSINAE